jgi:septal ring factor EnvC (AmiA/AmiB activator)
LFAHVRVLLSGKKEQHMKTLSQLFAGKATVPALEAALADIARRTATLEQRRAQVQQVHQHAIEARRAALLGEREAAQKKCEAAVRGAASELEGLTDALEHLRQERARVEADLAAARERDRRQAEVAECERQAAEVERALEQAAAAARAIEGAAAVLGKAIDPKPLGLRDNGASAQLLRDAALAGLRRASAAAPVTCTIASPMR